MGTNGGLLPFPGSFSFIPLDSDSASSGLHYFISPELADINVELNDLISFPFFPSVNFPCYGRDLLTTVIIREDDRRERRLYPYLWFPGVGPYQLQEQEYDNVCLVFPGAMEMGCGILALTAGLHAVLFFQGENHKAATDVLVERMEPGVYNSANWQGTTGVSEKNDLFVFMGHDTEQYAQGSSGSNASQSNIAQSGYSTTQYPSVDFIWQTSNSAVAESSTSTLTQEATRQPVSKDTAKRRQNGSPSDIPIFIPIREYDTLQPVSGPSMSYPTNTIFTETHTTESFPHPQNRNPVALSISKRRSRRRPVKSSSPYQTTRLQSYLEPGGKVKQRPKAQRRGKKAGVPELPPRAGLSINKVLESITPNVYHVPQEDAHVFQASASYTMHQVAYAGNATTNQFSQPPYTNVFGEFDQFSTVHPAHQYEYLNPNPAVNTANQIAPPDIVTGYETGDATTSQTSFPQPSYQVVNAEATGLTQTFAASRDQVPAPPFYSAVPAYTHAHFLGANENPWGHRGAQPSVGGLRHDANGLFSMTGNEACYNFIMDPNVQFDVVGPSASAVDFDGHYSLM